MIIRWPAPVFSPPDAPGATPAAGSAPPGSPPPSPPPAGSAPPVRPEQVPETYWDSTTGLKPEFFTHYGEVATFHKTETEKRAAIPATADAYVLEGPIKLPETVKVPNGEDGKPLQFAVNKDDPRIPMVRAFAHQFGLPQEAVNQLVALDAQMQIADINAAAETRAAEAKKLGANFPTRKTAVETFLKGAMTGDQAAKDAKYHALLPVVGNAAAFEAIEDLIARATATGVPRNHGDPPPPKAPEKPLVQAMFPGRFGPDGKLKTG